MRPPLRFLICRRTPPAVATQGATFQGSGCLLSVPLGVIASSSAPLRGNEYNLRGLLGRGGNPVCLSSKKKILCLVSQVDNNLSI